jgi:hypothetical protein
VLIKRPGPGRGVFVMPTLRQYRRSRLIRLRITQSIQPSRRNIPIQTHRTHSIRFHQIHRTVFKQQILTQIEDSEKDLNVISVNDSNVAKSFGINQFPIIKFLKDGKEPATFSGERKSENFVKFAMENI